jgi:hypothetical protein
MEPFRRVFQALHAAVCNRQSARLNRAAKSERSFNQITEPSELEMKAFIKDKPATTLPQIKVKVAGGSVPYRHASMFNHFAAFEIKRWPRGKRGRYTLSDPIFSYGRFKLSGNPLADWAQAKTEADPSLSLLSVSCGGPQQHNSCIEISEAQNNDGHMISYGRETSVDGRHFQLELYLSKPMWLAVLRCMPPDYVRFRDQYSQYAIVVPLNDKLEGRPITLNSDEPFLSKASLPCSELVILQVRHRGSAIDRTLAHYLTEWTADEC